MAKRRYNAFKDEQIEQAKRRKPNPPPNAPVGPKAMNGITRTAMEQHQLVTSSMPQDYVGIYNASSNFNNHPSGGSSAYANNVFPSIQQLHQSLQQSQQVTAVYQQQYMQNPTFPQMPCLQYGAQPQQQYAQQMPNPQQHYTYPQSHAVQQFVQSPSSQQGSPRKRKMQQAQSMSPAFKKHKSNSTNASAPQIQSQLSAEKPTSLQSTVTSTSVPSSSVEPPNGIPGASKPQYAAPNLQTQGQQLAENIPPLLSTLTGISIPTSCAEPSGIIRNGAMLPLLVEYAHLLFQKNVDDFGKIFDLMTEAMQQEMIRKTEEEGLRGFAEQVAKYAMWQIISFSQLDQGNSVIFQKASFFVNKVRTDQHGDDEVEAEEDYVTKTSDIQIGLPLQFGSSCAPAFTAMIEAMHNTRPLGKVQCCKCRGWGSHGKGNCPTLADKEELNMNSMNMWLSNKQDDILKDKDFDTFLQNHTASIPTSSGIPYIRADGRILTNWATSHVPLALQQDDFNFCAINSHHYHSAQMYQAVVPMHLRFQSVLVSTELNPSVRIPLMLMNIQRESRKLLVDRTEQLVDPIWEICLDTLNSFSSTWQKYMAAQHDDVHLLGRLKNQSELSMGAAIHKVDGFLANLLFYKADAKKLLNLMQCFEKQQDDVKQMGAAMTASANTNKQAAELEADPKLRAALAASASDYAHKAEDLKKVAADSWSGTTEFGSFETIRNLLDARIKLYDAFEAYMGILGQRFADWFLDDYFTKDKTARKALAKEFFPGLARLFAGRLDPYARLGSYCPPRWTIAQRQIHDGSWATIKPKMAWVDYGRAEPTTPDFLDHFLNNPDSFQDSFTTTDMHDFGYVHDQMLLWNLDFPSAVHSLHRDKQTYQENKDRKHAEVANAKQKLEDNPLSWDKDAKPCLTPGETPSKRSENIEKMAIDARYAFCTLVASTNITEGYRSKHNVKARAKLPNLAVLDVDLYHNAHVNAKLQISQSTGPTTSQEVAAFMTSAPRQTDEEQVTSAVIPFSSRVMKKPETGQATGELKLGSGMDHDSDLEMMTVSNDRCFAPNSVAGRPHLDSTITPPDVCISSVDANAIVDNSETVRGLSAAIFLTTQPMELPDELPNTKQPQNARSVEVEHVPTTPRQLLSTPLGVHSPQIADQRNAVVTTPLKQAQSAEMSPRGTELKAILLARRAANKEVKKAQHPTVSATQGWQLATKRSREDDYTENVAFKRRRSTNGDAPVVTSSLQPTLTREDKKCSEPTPSDGSMSLLALFVNASGSNLPAAALHSPAMPSPLRQVFNQQDAQTGSSLISSIISPINSTASSRSPASPAISKDNPEALAHKRKRNADDSDLFDRSLVNKRQALSSQLDLGSSTVAPRKKEEAPSPKFLGPDGKIQVNICKDRYSARRIRVSRPANYKSLDLDMAEVEVPDYTVY